MYIKPRFEEVLIGAALGAGAGLAVASLLLLLTHAPLPSLWPPILKMQASVWLRLEGAWVIGLALSGAFIGGWLASQQESVQHLNGVRYFADEDEARDALAEQFRPHLNRAHKAGRVRGIELAGVELPRGLETEHCLVSATSGGGKTVLLTQVLDQARARGDRVMVHDPKAELVSTHLDAHARLLGLWDQRASILDTADIDSPALAHEFADAICGVREDDEYIDFHRGASLIMAGALIALMRRDGAWTWAGLLDVLALPARELAVFAAQGSRLVSKVLPHAFLPLRKDGSAPEPNRTEASILFTLATNVATLMQIAAADAGRPDAPRISIREWFRGEAHTDISLLILNTHADYEKACAALWGILLSIAASEVASGMPNRSPDEPGVWILADELPQMGTVSIRQVQKIVELGRSRGCRVWLVLQDESQLAAKLGGEGAAPVLATQALRVYLRTAAAGATTIAQRYGEREVLRIESTTSQGAVPGKTARHDHVPAILPSAFSGLRVLQDDGVEMIIGVGDVLCRVKQPFAPRHPPIAASFVACEFWRAGEPSIETRKLYAEPVTSMGDSGQTSWIDGSEVNLPVLPANERSPNDASGDGIPDWRE